ncbi:MAG TPA: c-type cytochrome [Vicinamibacterales bacterium]|nr:c-type cytochrome [Vicinamibacterales bacterium]
MHLRHFLLTLLAGLALPVLARPATAQPSADHQYTSADIEAGSRLYAAQCSLCHGPTGDGINGVDLRRGVFRRSVSDEDLAQVITTGIAAAGMPGFKFQPSELNAVIAYIRAGFDPSGTAVKVGDPARGKALYAGKGNCGSCHRVNGTGPRTAPDLSDIGAVRTPSALQRSLLDPTSAMLPINRPVRAVTKDGRTVRGRRLNEDTYTVQLIDDQERLVSLVKADLREYELGKTSPMPPAGRSLSADEVADLVAYLLTLKGGL